MSEYKNLIESMDKDEFAKKSAKSMKFLKGLKEEKGQDYLDIVRSAVEFKVLVLELASVEEEGKARELASVGGAILGMTCEVFGFKAADVQRDAQMAYDLAEEEVKAILKEREGDKE
jgi:hypothetical protein